MQHSVNRIPVWPPVVYMQGFVLWVHLSECCVVLDRRNRPLYLQLFSFLGLLVVSYYFKIQGKLMHETNTFIDSYFCLVFILMSESLNTKYFYHKFLHAILLLCAIRLYWNFIRFKQFKLEGRLNWWLLHCGCRPNDPVCLYFPVYATLLPAFNESSTDKTKLVCAKGMVVKLIWVPSGSLFLMAGASLPWIGQRLFEPKPPEGLPALQEA